MYMKDGLISTEELSAGTDMSKGQAILGIRKQDKDHEQSKRLIDFWTSQKISFMYSSLHQATMYDIEGFYVCQTLFELLSWYHHLPPTQPVNSSDRQSKNIIHNRNFIPAPLASFSVRPSYEHMLASFAYV